MLNFSGMLVKKIEFFIFLCLSVFVYRLRMYGDTTLDFQVVMRLFSWGYVIFVSFFFFFRRGFFIRGGHEVILVFFLSLSVLYLPFSVAFERSLVAVFSYFAFYLYLKMLFESFSFCDVISIVLFGCCGGILLSFIFYFFIPDVGRHAYWLDGQFYVSSRMSGVFGTSNALGDFCAVSLLLLLRGCRDFFFKKWVLLFWFSMFFAGLVLSNSKTAMVAFIVSSIFLFRSDVVKFYLLYVAAVLFVFLAIWVVNDSKSFLVIISRHGDPEEVLTFTGRSYIWPVVIDMIKDNFVFGYGLAVTSVVLSKMQYIIGYSPAHAHNLWLQAFFSLGFLGGISVVFLSLYNFVKRQNEIICFVLSLYLLVGSFFESSFLMGVASFSFVAFVFMVLAGGVAVNNKVELVGY